MTRHVAVLTVGLMEPLRIPEVDDPWMQRSDRLPFPVEWSARIYVRRPEDVTGELRRQMGKVRSQIRHYTHDHDLDPPMSLARQAEQVLAIEDELSSGLTQLNTRPPAGGGSPSPARRGGDDTARAAGARPVPAEDRGSSTPRPVPAGQGVRPRRAAGVHGLPAAGSVTWVAAGDAGGAASVGDGRGIMLGETCTATRRPVAWDPWLAQEVRRASGLTAIVGGLGSGKCFLTGPVVHKTLRGGPAGRCSTRPARSPGSPGCPSSRRSPGTST